MIEIYCVCGRRYEVPPERVGRRLQCRRCGNVQRIGGDGAAPPASRRPERPPAEQDPLAWPGEPGGAGQGRGGSRRGARCPGCGFPDDPQVVVCIRCGFDRRTGRRVEATPSEVGRVDDGSEEETRRLASLGWWALSPLGVVVGPLVIVRSLALEKRLRRSGQTPLVLQQLRLTAAAGAGLWLVVLLLLGGLALRRSGRGVDAQARECRARLERVGRALQTRLRAPEAGPFPPGGKALGDALRALPGLSPDDLSCPIHGGLYPYRVGTASLLTPEARPDFLVAWDGEGHPEPGASVSTFRALRLDGVVVALSQADLNQAAALTPFRTSEPSPVEVTPDAGPGATPPGPGGELEAQLDRLGRRLQAFAGEYDDRDPYLLEGLVVPPAVYLERLGVPAEELLPMLARSGDPAVQVAVSRVAARLTLPQEDLSRLLTQVEGALAPKKGEELPLATRYPLAMGLRRAGQGTWLPRLGALALAGDPEQRDLVLRALTRFAASEPTVLEAILELAVKLRAERKLTGADPLFPLGRDAWRGVAALLAQPRLSAEASAVLYAGRDEALPILLEVLDTTRESGLRLAAFKTLAALQADGTYPLADYLDRVVACNDDPTLQAAAVQGLRLPPGPPPPRWTQWALGRLRAGDTGEALRQALRPSLTATPLAGLLDDLREEGDHAAVLTELGTPARRVDPALDEGLVSRWRDLRGDAALRERLIALLAERPLESALLALVRLAEDRDAEVRAKAIEGLNGCKGPITPDVRRAVLRLLVKQLPEEEHPAAKLGLYRLAALPCYCVPDPAAAAHECDNKLVNALQQLARKGDLRAVDTLARHASEKAAGVLLRLLDGEQNPGVRDALTGALRDATGSGETTHDSSVWKRLLQQRAQPLLEHQARLWAQHGRWLTKHNEDAEHLLGELTAKAGRR